MSYKLFISLYIHMVEAFYTNFIFECYGHVKDWSDTLLRPTVNGVSIIYFVGIA